MQYLAGKIFKLFNFVSVCSDVSRLTALNDSWVAVFDNLRVDHICFTFQFFCRIKFARSYIKFDIFRQISFIL